MPHDELTPAEQQALARERMQDRIRAGTGDDTSPGAMLEEIMEGEIMEGEMTKHLSADYREQTPGRRGERNGYRELLAAEVAPGERTEVWRDLIKDLLDRKLRGVRLVISDDADAIKTAVAVELPQATRRNFCAWQRCTVHFQHNILAKVLHKGTKVVGVFPSLQSAENLSS